jgi:hypothetical protein
LEEEITQLFEYNQQSETVERDDEETETPPRPKKGKGKLMSSRHSKLFMSLHI